VIIMDDVNRETTFRSLPLTSEQEREVKHYIYMKARKGAPWDTPELKAMLTDMLNPPEVVDDDTQATDDSMAAERMTADGEESIDTDQLQSHRR
jgi:hypothetical protein